MTKRKSSKKLKQETLKDRLSELVLGLLGQVIARSHPKRLSQKAGLSSSLSVLLQTLQPQDTLSDFKAAYDALFREFFAQSSSRQAKDVYQQGLRWIQAEFASLVSNQRFDEIGEYQEYLEDEKPKSRNTRNKGAAEGRLLLHKLTLEKMNFGQKYALVQKGADGTYFFTSALTRFLDDVHCDTSAAKVKIQVSRPLPSEAVPKLGVVASVQTRRQAQKKALVRVRTVPAEFPEYGPFHSFAPAIDSSRSTLSRAESILVRFPNRKVYLEPGIQEPLYTSQLPIYRGELDPHCPQLLLLPSPEELKKLPEPTLVKQDPLILSDEHIDTDLLLDAGDRPLPKEPVQGTQPLLYRNSLLLKKLISLQQERLLSLSQVSSQELEIAASLQMNLAKLLSNIKPNDVVQSSQIQDVMRCVQKTEKAYKGSLPQQAPFAFPCNTAGNGVIPAGGGTLPLTNSRKRR